MRKALIGILMAATMATPLAAQDNERGWRQNRGEHSSESRGDRGAARQQQQQQAAPQQQAPQQAAPQQRNYQGGERGQRQQWQGRNEQVAQGQGWQGRNGQAGQGQGWQGRNGQAGQGQGWQGRNGQAGQGQAWQGRGGYDRGQQSTLDTQGLTPHYQRQGERNQQRYGNQSNWQQQDRRSDRYRDDRRDNGGSWNNGRNDWNQGRGRQTYDWNRGWRNDNRYDWQRYRYSNRNIFRGGPYYSPYQNYGYNRLGIGIILDSLFYDRNYWISDPYSYHLPASPAGTQWVRYYNDVVLVDVYTGEVIDVINDFFW
jgi:hypothetical protein